MSEQPINIDAERIATKDEAVQLAKASISENIGGEIIVKATHDEGEQYPSKDGPKTVPGGHVRIEVVDRSGDAIPVVHADQPRQG
jgi:hypothetical protein